MLLIDHDSPDYYRMVINNYPDIPVLVYPHGALSYFAWNGLWKLNPRTTAFLAYSSGQAEAMKMYGYPNPIHEIGWHWCEQKPFRHIEQPKKLLFAPIHPLNNGWMWQEIKERNAEILDMLIKSDMEVTVRYIGSIASNGLWHDGRANYVQGNQDNSFVDIDHTDVVVAHGTFAYMSVARGTPTIMYAQDITLWDGSKDDNLRFVNDWETYRELIEYPYSIEDGMSPSKPLIDYVVKEWADKYIGQPLTAERLNEVLEQYI